MSFCWGLPVDTESLEINVKQSVLAEQHNFDAVLVGSKQKALDPWLMASHLSQFTSTIRFLVAQNTNQVTPIHSSKSLHSLAYLNNGRVDINIVSGGAVQEIINTDNHANRYSRTREFIDIFMTLKDVGEICNYNGNYFLIDNYNLFPQPNNKFASNVCVAGSSDDAIDIAAAYADIYLVYANDLKLLENWYSKVRSKAEKLNRNITCGLLIDVIARETSKEAWEEAYKFEKRFTPIQKKMKKLYLNSVDSVGTESHRALLTYKNLRVDKNLWAGLAQISTSVPLSIVGSYQEVIDTIKKLQGIGAEYFIFSGMVGKEKEIIRIGDNILPYVK
ncbi:LLM class flavin-dependent oxidoreductase [Bacillus cereus]|uniref:LLM class flavin-dependent oxidoreductase n=1 Tax=Bacillus TaxID=1386 RepID=UPI000BF4EF72|nr:MULTISPECIES: LLM class flavin-dependent oxidoreductase [Bacillus]MDF9506993.1 LLM class flavin-dependent oxidoreductase [Bacillus cereus]MDF9596647.1 LLM class flavin-dependent oxidoreductase [Bacillus cereus]MDF9609770.1 LLM class flavin-dependent oxidoreductase [Bacillus cereus]MDF9659985.1 LLM class flavin-dependent oxidoreductase [Bacillus cereus]PFX72051.1 LLM class flavin-dependent oxidoreductase [Bacillus cereus]